MSGGATKHKIHTFADHGKYDKKLNAEGKKMQR